MALSDRIKIVLQENHISQYELAKRLNVSQATVAFWCTGRTKNLRGDYASKLSRLFGYSLQWLTDGIPPQRPSEHSLSPAEIGARRIPLIEFKDIPFPIDGKVYPYLLTDMDISDRAFAVAIKDSSMLPKFEVGDRIIIDPEVQPVPGDFVIVRIDDQEPIFRKLKDRGSDASGNALFEFIPLNDDFPVIRTDRHKVEIIGTMMEYRKYRKP